MKKQSIEVLFESFHFSLSGLKEEEKIILKLVTNLVLPFFQRKNVKFFIKFTFYIKIACEKTYYNKFILINDVKY